MPRFEVFIPPAQADGLALTLRVSAESWMAALKMGLRKIGEGALPQNVACDVNADDSVHVLDPRTGRTFRIVEAARAALRDAAEEALVDLFERVPAVFQKPQAEGLYYLLDLALEKIPSDAGSVWLADLNRHDLRFAAARGPKAAELLGAGISVPMGQGLVGFCAQEGVGVVAADAARDPRHRADVAGRFGYEAKTVLTTPILAAGRTHGAIQLVNRKGEAAFSQAELAMLHYVAHQAAVYLEAQEGTAP